LLARGDREAAAEATLMVADVFWKQGRSDDTAAYLEDARALVADAPPSRIQVSVLSEVARYQMLADENESAIETGTEALRLRHAAAAAAIRAGDSAGAAMNLARAAELINRAPGMMATRPGDGEVIELLAAAWALAGGDAGAQARLLTAEAFSGDEFDPLTAELTDRAITLARRAGDPLTESAALDQLTAIQLARGEVRAATASALRRIDLLAPIRMTALSGLEFSDAHGMAAECCVAAGDLQLGHCDTVYVSGTGGVMSEQAALILQGD
jgi:hypothetical protein